MRWNWAARSKTRDSSHVGLDLFEVVTGHLRHETADRSEVVVVHSAPPAPQHNTVSTPNSSRVHTASAAARRCAMSWVVLSLVHSTRVELTRTDHKSTQLYQSCAQPSATYFVLIGCRHSELNRTVHELHVVWCKRSHWSAHIQNFSSV